LQHFLTGALLAVNITVIGWLAAAIPYFIPVSH
jgi:hypothetical protein